MTRLTTERLILRPWREEDLPDLARINADPRVMEHFPSVMSEEESRAMLARLMRHQREHGFAPLAMVRTGSERVIGCAGLQVPAFAADFTPCVEIAWRLDADHWGQELATEAARAALEDGFGRLGLAEILSFTVPANRRSWRLMERLGMRRDPAADFDHPGLPPGHRLSRHWLYRLRRD
ncbi:GNAT family N-acetyltransferase [Paludibacterium paludis]|nr:GNAT family N-acetyltransferase [Paludibacterium paludis]